MYQKRLIFCLSQNLFIYDTILFCCLNCRYLAQHVLAWLFSSCGFPYAIKTSIFCDMLPAPVQEVLVFDLVPREESKAKVIVLATAAELEVPVS